MPRRVAVILLTTTIVCCLALGLALSALTQQSLRGPIPPQPARSSQRLPPLP